MHLTYNIKTHLDKHHILFKNNHWFQKACETQLFVFVHKLHFNIENKMQTDAAFSDFFKAFGRGPNESLIATVAHLRILPSLAH